MNTTNSSQTVVEEQTDDQTPTDNPISKTTTKYAAAGSVTFTQAQIIEANTWVKNYIETNQELPDYVTINSINVNMPSFLQLLTTLTLKINKTDTTDIEYILCGNAATPKDSQKKGTMTQAKYIEIAGKVKDYMDRNLVAPNYSSYSNLGTYFGYENLVYTYSKIIASYNSTGKLPTTIKVVPWSYIVNYAGTFTIQQTTTAATWVKNYIETYQKLPNTITITGTNLQGTTITKQITIPAFLELLTTVTLKINNTDTTSTDSFRLLQKRCCTQGLTKKGTMTLAKYIEIAGKVKDYMDRNLVAPNYSSYSNLGTYFGYENLIYTYSKILNSYSTTNPQKLPTTIKIVPWNLIINYTGTFTIQQTTTAATWVKNYIETYQKLPNTVTITGTNLQGTTITKQITIPAFLELLTSITLKINNTDNTPADLADYYKIPTATKDSQKKGTMTLTKYVDIAGRVNDYMNSNLVAPNYSSYSNLGTYFGYQNLIYTYSKILNSYSTTNPQKLPTNIIIYPWSLIVNYAGTFTNNQTADAATWVKEYIETNHKLPNSVTINGTNLQGTTITKQITIPAFLELLTTVTLKINNTDDTPTDLADYYKTPTAPKDCQRIGSLLIANYVDISGRVKAYMDKNWIAPNYSRYSTLGTYFGYQNLIYIYSKILNTYNVNGTLPRSVSVKLWKAVIDPDGIWGKTVYITSDYISSNSADLARMNKIKEYLESWGVKAVVYGRGPNTHCSVLQSSNVPETALIVDIYGGACAGTIYEMGTSWYKGIKGAA